MIICSPISNYFESLNSSEKEVQGTESEVCVTKLFLLNAFLKHHIKISIPDEMFYQEKSHPCTLYELMAYDAAQICNKTLKCCYNETHSFF